MLSPVCHGEEICSVNGKPLPLHWIQFRFNWDVKLQKNWRRSCARRYEAGSSLVSIIQSALKTLIIRGNISSGQVESDPELWLPSVDGSNVEEYQLPLAADSPSFLHRPHKDHNLIFSGNDGGWKAHPLLSAFLSKIEKQHWKYLVTRLYLIILHLKRTTGRLLKRRYCTGKVWGRGCVSSL